MKNYIKLTFWNRKTEQEFTIQIEKSNISTFRLYNITNTLRLMHNEYVPGLVVNQYHIIAKTNEINDEIIQNYILDEILITKTISVQFYMYHRRFTKMPNLTITQQLKAHVQQIELIKKQNHLLLSQFISTDKFLNLLNDTKLEAEPIETYVIDNTVQIKYNYYTNIGFKIVLTDKEIVNSEIKTIFKNKVSEKIKEIDVALKGIEDSARKISEKFNADDFKK